MFSAAMIVISILIGMNAPAACANETRVQSGFEEHRVEFHNGDVKLAGSLLLPKSEKPLPAVIFVHGAGPQTREQYRKQGEYFVSQGIAALIYDKRGTGQSSGAYESRKPYDNLVNDALAGVALLKQRREIAPSQIGLWGLSQGGSICAAAASRSTDIQFIVAVGSEVADGMLFYYRDNLFRRYGLSATLRDVAEKAQLGADTLFFNLRDESLLSTFAPRTYPPPNEYVQPAWSRVRQPVLVMWGQLDQHQPVGESILGLKNSLAKANNQKWTMIILPQANHDLKVSETGELHRPSPGYVPGALKTMTDWVHGVIDDPAHIPTMKQEGSAQPSNVLSKLIHYEKLRWYGNGTVQVALFVLFLFSFLVNTIAGFRCGLARQFHRHKNAALQAPGKVLSFKRAICALNLLILAAMQVVVLMVFDQMHPSCPTFLLYLPLLGTASMLATVALLVVLVRTRREDGWTVAARIRSSLDVLCLILFVPYMFYWNLIGYRF
jgi:dienelactone hydrolase